MTAQPAPAPEARPARVPLGWVTAAFFVAVFPGNISPFTTGNIRERAHG